MNIKIPEVQKINNHLTEVTIGDVHVFILMVHRLF